MRMPENLRAELSSEAYGILLRGTPAQNALKVKGMMAAKGPPKVIAVGDFTLKILLDSGTALDVGIFDRLTKRAACDFPNIEAETVKNPPGEITDEAVSLIKKALKSRRRMKVFIAVDGEEDLLALPAIANAPVGSLVIYGIPDRGMMVITADRETKKKVESLIGQFQKTD